MNFPQLHKTQKVIIKSLIGKQALKYNELKSSFEEIDPNRFQYHLDKLVEKELIEYDLRNRLYKLTTHGKSLPYFFGDFDEGNDEFGINTFGGLYLCRDNKVLVVERELVPYLGRVGIPTFFMKKSQFIHETANEFLNSIGLKGNLEKSLILETIYKKGQQTLSHSNFYIFNAKTFNGEATSSSWEGKLRWIGKDELLALNNGYKDTETIIKFFDQKVLPENTTIISKVDEVTQY